MEDLEKLLDFRNLEEGFKRHPLNEFFGTLDGIVPEENQEKDANGNLTGRTWVTAIFKFSDVDVPEGGSSEPYTLTITDLPISISKNGKSRWGILAKSAAGFTDFMGNEVTRFLMPEENVKDLIGKQLHMKLCKGHKVWNPEKKAEVETSMWEIIGVDGIDLGSILGAQPITDASPSTPAPTPAPASANGNATSKAIDFLDGKSMDEFNAGVFQNPELRGDNGLIQSILDKSFYSKVIADGKMTVGEDGIYHKV